MAALSPPLYRRASVGDYATLADWIDDLHGAMRWAGPEITAWPPANGVALAAALHRPGSRYGVLVDPVDRPLAFGECYIAASGRLRFARLVVAPENRGRHLIDRLIEALATDAAVDYGRRDQELGVYRDNPAALRAYFRLGFRDIDDDWPDGIATLSRSLSP